MPCRLLLFALTAILLTGAAWSPPAVYANDYLLFTAEMEGTRGQVYQMDAEGNLSLKQEYEVGGDSHNITASPDGRVVVVSNSGPPRLSVFFIDEGGVVSPPVYLDGSFYPNYYPAYNPTIFHPNLPIFYSGFEPISGYRYSLPLHEVEPTSQTIILDSYYPSFHLGFSPLSGTLVSLVVSPDTTPDKIQTVQIKEDGSFGQSNPPLSFLSVINSDFAVSPDGRWAAAATINEPQLQFVRINQDGSANLTQALTFAYKDMEDYPVVAFTPDSRHLLLLVNADYPLVSYDIDPQQGTLIKHDKVADDAPGFYLDPIQAIAVTPDGRFAVFPVVNYNNLAHNLLCVVRIHEDGTLEYLQGKEMDVDRHLSAVGVVMLPPKNAARGWGMYE